MCEEEKEAYLISQDDGAVEASPLTAKTPAAAYEAYCTVKGVDWFKGIPDLSLVLGLSLEPTTSPWLLSQAQQLALASNMALFLAPILVLRMLNRYVATKPFRMLTIRQLLECVNPGDWMTFCVTSLCWSQLYRCSTWKSVWILISCQRVCQKRGRSRFFGSSPR